MTKNELIEKSYGSQMSENSNHGDERTSLQCRQKLGRKKAKADPILREKLLQTRENPNPIHAFCEICHAYGVSIYEMDLAMAGEEFYAEIKRSTNGGGENSPALEGEDDFYELFLATLENI